jgi:hypothetical protein
MSEGPRRVPGWLLPVGLAVMVVSLVTIALARGPVDLDPDSPEGTVQEYLRAIDQERWDDAVEVIHADWRGKCAGEDLAAFAQGDFSAELGAPDGMGGFGVGLGREPMPVEAGAEPPPGADTTVEVTIRHQDAGGLGGGWDEYVVFELTDTDDFWWIVNDPWPYFVWNCRGIG